MTKSITVEAIVSAPIETVWSCWTEPEHITKWCHASDDWEAPYAENDVQEGGRFKTTMSAKDKSVSFDFTGAYTAVELHKHLAYAIDDGRKVTIDFAETPEGVRVTETFDMENENSEEMQRGGWQAILDNFKAYTEAQT